MSTFLLLLKVENLNIQSVTSHGLQLSINFSDYLPTFFQLYGGQFGSNFHYYILVTTHFRHPKLCMQIFNVGSAVIKTVTNLFLISSNSIQVPFRPGMYNLSTLTV